MCGRYAASEGFINRYPGLAPRAVKAQPPLRGAWHTAADPE